MQPILAQLLRADLLSEAWIAPVQVRQLRALLRHRASLVRLGTQLRNRIHAVAADHGYDRSAGRCPGSGSRLILRQAPGAAGQPGKHISRPKRGGFSRRREGLQRFPPGGGP